MDITRVRLTKKSVAISYRNNNEEITIQSKDNPRPEFIKAVEALVPLIIETLELPKEYAGRKQIGGDEAWKLLTSTGLTVSYKGESRQVCLVGKKDLDNCNSPFNIVTPNRMLDDPTEEGAVSTQFTTKQQAVIENVLDEAKEYVRGNRAQGQLGLSDEPEDVYSGEEELEIPEAE